jgi:hypothetical protein
MERPQVNADQLREILRRQPADTSPDVLEVWRLAGGGPASDLRQALLLLATQGELAVRQVAGRTQLRLGEGLSRESVERIPRQLVLARARLATPGEPRTLALRIEGEATRLVLDGVQDLPTPEGGVESFFWLLRAWLPAAVADAGAKLTAQTPGQLAAAIWLGPIATAAACSLWVRRNAMGEIEAYFDTGPELHPFEEALPAFLARAHHLMSDTCLI